MIYIDLKKGVTFSLLLSIASSQAPELNSILKNQFARWENEKNAIQQAFFASLQKKDPAESILSLHDSCKKLLPVSISTATAFHEASGQDIRELAALANIKSLDPFELCAYISFTVFLQYQKEVWKFLTPAISTDSDTMVFSLFNDRKMILNTMAPSLSSFLAAFLIHHFEPFIEHSAPCTADEIADISDPVWPGITARLFSIKEQLPSGGDVVVIEANIDDMTPELIGQAMQRMLDNGALDYTITPVVMKKGRPGFQIQILAKPEQRVMLEELLLLHTSTFGVRTTSAERRILERSLESFESSYGKIKIKKGYYKNQYLRSVPEFEEITRLSNETGLPCIKIYHDVLAEINQRTL